jgi:hypothetical protein
VISKEQFFAGLQKIKDSAANENPDEILVNLMRVNAEIGDEHTTINYTGNQKLFPLFAIG